MALTWKLIELAFQFDAPVPPRQQFQHGELLDLKPPLNPIEDRWQPLVLFVRAANPRAVKG
jgi:hypothetical protein